MRYRLLVIVVCWALFGLACEGTSRSESPSLPTSPAPTMATRTPCPPCPLPGEHALSGVVRASGMPMAGARVGLVRIPEETVPSGGPEELIASTMTDNGGAYNFAKVENVSFSGALVAVVKAGYFTDTKYIQMSEDRQLDFDLERAVNISVGQVFLSQVGEARCASGGYGGMGGALCRRFALPIRTSGMLHVTVASNPASPFDINVLRSDGTIGAYNSSSVSPVGVTLPATAGLTYQIDVVAISPATREFELTTGLR